MLNTKKRIKCIPVGAALFLWLLIAGNILVHGQDRLEPSANLAVKVINSTSRIVPSEPAKKNLDANQGWRQFGNQFGWKTNADLVGDLKLGKRWEQTLDEGRSQIVGNKTTIYVTTGVGTKDNKTKRVSVASKIQAIDIESQNVNWTFQFNSTLHEKQETFGGSSPAPQSTPLLIGSKIVAVSFTGQLICLNCENGKLLWQKDLVDDFGASPVQFGFSSSPVSDSTDSFVVLAAGKSGGLLNVDTASGKLNWKSKLATPSYATPTLATIDGIPQWLVVTENHLVGIQKSDGSRLWRYQLPNKGLTNVPSPIVVGRSSICISGQGCGGTQCVHVKKTADGWLVKEAWSQPRVQFFYTNWLMLDQDTLLGCTDSFLAAIDVKTGEVVGRWRGFRDGNVIRCGNDVWIVDGKGTLSNLTPKMGATSKRVMVLLAESKYKLTDGRCWTPISVIEKKLFIRTKNQLDCYDLESNQARLENVLSKTTVLKLHTEPSVDPVAMIFDAFEKNGQNAAMKLYSQLRTDGKLSVQHRLQLASAANGQSLIELAEMILQHTVDDFPKSKEAKSALRKARDQNSK